MRTRSDLIEEEGAFNSQKKRFTFTYCHLAKLNKHIKHFLGLRVWQVGLNYFGGKTLDQSLGLFSRLFIQPLFKEITCNI